MAIARAKAMERASTNRASLLFETLKTGLVPFLALAWRKTHLMSPWYSLPTGGKCGLVPNST